MSWINQTNEFLLNRLYGSLGQFEILVLLGYFLGRMGDFVVHKRHFDSLKVFDIREGSRSLMRAYYGFDILFPLLLLSILAFTGGVTSSKEVMTLAVFGLSFGFILRIWSIMTLGSIWTMRCLYFPGLENLRDGPFRFLRHPEYVARSIEAMSLCVCLGVKWMILPTLTLYVIFTLLIIRQLAKLRSIPKPNPPGILQFDNG